MDSDTDFSSDNDYDEFANDSPVVCDMLQPIKFEAAFTAAEIHGKKRSYL